MPTLVDAHVHFHECFSLPTFLDAAASNFKRVATDKSISESQNIGVLALCQISAGDPLELLELRNSGAWLRSTPDAQSLVFSRENNSIVVVAGRQIIASEKLELLSLCSSSTIPDGMSLCDSVHAVVDFDGIPVLPWGFGKWTLRRGRILRELLRSGQLSASRDALLLGDNACRVGFLRPSMLAFGESLGFRVIAGSDPLPLPNHVMRPGSFGTILDSTIDLTSPTAWLRQQLRHQHSSPKTFGNCRSFTQFVRDQIRLRIRSK